MNNSDKVRPFNFKMPVTFLQLDNSLSLNIDFKLNAVGGIAIVKNCEIKIFRQSSSSTNLKDGESINK